jgi:hypothetical protein
VRSDGSVLSERLNGRMTGPEDIDTLNARWPSSLPTNFSRANSRLALSRVPDNSPMRPFTSERTPRGLPAMLAESGAFDPRSPEAPPSGGLPGLIREFLLNH